MKIWDNRKQGLYLVRSVLKRNKYIKPIEEARKSGDFVRERQLILEVSHDWANDLIKHFDVHMNIINPENLPQNGPVVFVSNHQSYADILPFMGYVPFQCGFVAKEEFKKIYKLGGWIERNRGIFIKRGNLRESLRCINEAAGYVRDGFSMIIFPEGTRSHGGPTHEFKAGSFKLALKAQAILVPVTIRGSYKFYEEHNVVTNGVGFDVIFHEPIDCSKLTRQEQLELPERVEKIIIADL